MLILTRKEEESIIINEEIEIKVVKISDNRIQLGIEAPESIPVHREEVYRKIQAENKLAAQVNKELSDKLSKIAKKDLKRDDLQEK